MEPSAATVQYKHAAMSSGVSIQLLMLGKDNPNGSTGIVFCRQTWAEQTHRTCPGRYVLEALGVDWRIESERSAAPMELFYKLMRAGVVFLSPCYAPATGKPLDRLTYRIALDVGDVFNREILNPASVVSVVARPRLWKELSRLSVRSVEMKCTPIFVTGSTAGQRNAGQRLGARPALWPGHGRSSQTISNCAKPDRHKRAIRFFLTPKTRADLMSF